MLPPEHVQAPELFTRDLDINPAKTYFPGTSPCPGVGKMVGYKAASGIYEGAY